MKKLSIEQAVVTIQVVRVGNRKMTKAVWAQIPGVSLVELLGAREKTILGWVNQDRRGYLVQTDGEIGVVKDTYVLDARRKDASELAIEATSHQFHPFLGHVGLDDLSRKRDGLWGGIENSYAPSGFAFNKKQSETREAFIQRVKSYVPEFDEDSYSFGSVRAPESVVAALQHRERVILGDAASIIRDLQAEVTALFQNVPQLYIAA